MNKNEYNDFEEIWLTAHESSANGRNLSKKATMMIFEDLAEFDIEIISKALKLHRRQNEFAPTVKNIFDILETGSNHVAADEAWMLCPSSEEETAVWTEEIKQSYFLSCGTDSECDNTARRMAFKAIYQRLVSEAKIKNLKPVWSVSVGKDKKHAKQVIDKAFQDGKISQAVANNTTPRIADGGVIGKFLTDKVVNINIENNKKQISKIKEMLGHGSPEEIFMEKITTQSQQKSDADVQKKDLGNNHAA